MIVINLKKNMIAQKNLYQNLILFNKKLNIMFIIFINNNIIALV